MEVEKINIQKARALKQMKREQSLDKFYVFSELFHAVIGKEEFKKMSNQMNDETKANIVLISITEPDNGFIEKEYI